MPSPLASSPQLAAYLGGAPANAEQAAFALDAASGLVRAYCQWTISAETATWTLVGDGTPALLVPTLMLRGLTEIAVDGTAIDLDEVSFGRSGVINRSQSWPARAQITVAADHGYVELPTELVAVVCSLASRWISGAGRGSMTSYRVGGVQASWGQNTPAESIGLHSHESAVLDRYRLAVLR